MKDKIKNITEAISEEVQAIMNRLIALSTNQLTKYVSSPSKYSLMQYANIQKFNKKLDTESEKAVKEISNIITNAFALAYGVAIQGEEPQLPIKEVSQKYVESLGINRKVEALSNGIKNQHIQNINRISRDSYIMKTPQELYERICNTVEEYGGVRNVPKVTYADGREFTWQAYMDMNVRTTMSHEIAQTQLENGQALGVVFYICSVHLSAPDHEDYQGKMYYDSNYRSFGYDEETLNKIESLISSQHMLSIQEVSESPPYLCTRPNCRHRFQSVSLEEALSSSPKIILQDHKLVFGKADAEHYKDLEQQRYNERQIRAWKNKLAESEDLLKNAPKGAENDLQSDIYKNKQKVLEWQKKQREFLKGKDYLERDYNRETISRIKTDVGAGLNRH